MSNVLAVALCRRSRMNQPGQRGMSLITIDHSKNCAYNHCLLTGHIHIHYVYYQHTERERNDYRLSNSSTCCTQP